MTPSLSAALADAEVVHAASAIDAAVATIAGMLLALVLRYTNPDTTLSFTIMMDILLMVVIGGMGTLYGSVIGWFKYDDLNADRIFRARMAEQAEINKQSENRMCREMPGHFMCGDNERRICTGNPNDARCKDYRECTTGPGLKQGWPKCAKYKDW